MQLEKGTFLTLLEQGLSPKEIAIQTGLSVGQVRYRIKKYGDVKEATNPTSTLKVDYTDIPLHSLEAVEDQLVLMPRDAHSLYVYWEITLSRKRIVADIFRCPWDALPKFLKIYDVSDMLFDGTNAHDTKDISITDIADNWFYFDVTPNRSYCMDYGTKTLDGRFFTILRSNVVFTPPGSAHSWKDHPVGAMEGLQPEAARQWMEQFTGYSLQKNDIFIENK